MMCMCAIRVGGSAARITHACGLKNSVAMEGYEVGHAYDAWEKIVILCDTSERAVDAAALRGALRSFSNSLGFLGKEDSPQYKSPHMLGSMGRHPKDGCTGDMGFQASLCVDYRALIDPDDEGTRNLRMIPWYNLVASAADLLDQGNNAAVAAARLHSQMQAIAEVALSIYYEGSGKVGCE
ncbi:unnamed protein product [Trypanosoma congolense IL3000]|uniref:WGS project CAEQ00000000 data, annotated contig 1201 n=1 Tax=Trypanosoma congolense (strain IL3000) TaxID=1068625 RepID=F9W4L6_TRYCI|nr:unnamed protein product [Trypanosoma congolense IL3000]